MKIRDFIPNSALARYIIFSDGGGGANNANAVGSVKIKLLALDFIYSCYRMKKAFDQQVSIEPELYFIHDSKTCPKKAINNSNDTFELL